MSKTRTTTIVTLRLVTVEEEFTDDVPPSLTAIPVEGEEVTETKGRPVVKTTAERWPWFRAAGGSRK